MIVYRIPIFLSILVSWIHTKPMDPVHITASIDCDQSVAQWCAHLVVYEEDTAHHHDMLKNEFFCTTEKSKAFTWAPINFGVWRDGSPEYEFGYHLSHTCSSDGQQRCMIPEKMIDVSVFWDQYVHFNITAFNTGELKKCPHPND